MHELSIAVNLLALIDKTARRHQMVQVNKVIVRAGELTAIVPQSLRFCFDEIKKGTVAAQAELQVEIMPLGGYCPQCQREFKIEALRFSCPQCQNQEIKVVTGEEISLYQVDGEKDGS